MTPEFDKIYKSIIGESVTISIADIDDKKSEHIGDISFKIQHNKPFTDFYNKSFSEEDKKKFQKERVFDFIAIDGYDYTENEGVLNFYTKGFPSNLVDKFVGVIKYYIEEYDGQVTGPVKKEQSGIYDSEVVRIPLKLQEGLGDNPPEMNLSNANGRVLLCDILGYDNDILEQYPRLNANELLMKIEMIEDNDYIIGKNSRETTTSGNIIDVGLPKERIKLYLDYLKKICQYAVDNNFTYLSLG